MLFRNQRMSQSRPRVSLFGGAEENDEMQASDEMQAPGRGLFQRGVQGGASGFAEGETGGMPNQGGGKSDVLKTILDIAIPAVIGGFSGDGALPGAAMGYYASEGRKNAEAANERGQFEKDRDFEQRERIFGARDQGAEENAKFDRWYKTQNLDLNRQKANQPGASNELSTYANAMEEIKKSAEAGLPVPTRARAIVDAYKAKNGIE